jgi:hypothetical protein
VADTAPAERPSNPPAEKAPAKTGIRPSDEKRCGEILEKLSLGEELTKAERDFQLDRCSK